MEEYCHSLLEKYQKGEIVLEFYTNQFTTQDVRLQPEDMVLTHLMVRPEFRRLGVGEALTRERLKKAQEKKSTAAYVQCWEGSHVVSLYHKLEFLPIIRFGPAYVDGEASTVLGKSLS